MMTRQGELNLVRQGLKGVVEQIHCITVQPKEQIDVILTQAQKQKIKHVVVDQ